MSSANPLIQMETAKGEIILELDRAKAPISVENFIAYASAGHYDGTIFHRVIPEFMIQGGDPAGTGMGGPGYRFEDETQGSPHSFDKAGKLAMANAGPGTNGSQFFITTVPTPWLTGKHTIFGEVIEGQDIVVAISRADTDNRDRPVKDVVLESVEISGTDGAPGTAG